MSGLWLNLGCGDNRLPAPWKNYDAELDIAKPIPVKDGSVQFVFAEHVTEHITCSEAYKFFEEVHRILNPGGVFRIAVPDILRISTLVDDEYLFWLGKSGFEKGSYQGAIRNICVNHGHKSLWTANTLITCLSACGFKSAGPCEYGKSTHPELCNVEGHHKVIGDHAAWVETTIVEATK